MLSCLDSDKNDLINYSGGCSLYNLLEFLTATVTKDLYTLSDKVNGAF
jgi:hypothetical protein